MHFNMYNLHFWPVLILQLSIVGAHTTNIWMCIALHRNILKLEQHIFCNSITYGSFNIQTKPFWNDSIVNSNLSMIYIFEKLLESIYLYFFMYEKSTLEISSIVCAKFFILLTPEMRCVNMVSWFLDLMVLVLLLLPSSRQ